MQFLGPTSKEIKSIRAPWELWAYDSLGNDILAQADAYAAEGKLSEAANEYRKTEQSPTSNIALKEEAFTRYLGTLLKLGDSKQVLLLMTQYVQAREIDIQDIPARLMLIAAFAYEHQGDVDQALAWYGMASRKGGSAVYDRSYNEAYRLIASFQEDVFQSQAQKWSTDSVIAPIFGKERLRRARGGGPNIQFTTNWFNPGIYKVTGAGISSEHYHKGIQTTTLSPAIKPTRKHLGVLTPTYWAV
jgi:tetratricopeptide (TPR) repeat protein